MSKINVLSAILLRFNPATILTVNDKLLIFLIHKIIVTTYWLINDYSIIGGLVMKVMSDIVLDKTSGCSVCVAKQHQQLPL